LLFLVFFFFLMGRHTQVKKADGSVDIVNMGPAGTPLTTGDKALLTIDVWEHAVSLFDIFFFHLFLSSCLIFVSIDVYV
jgi:hypothetical protein